jgi:hypothetical protein
MKSNGKYRLRHTLNQAIVIGGDVFAPLANVIGHMLLDAFVPG